MNNYLFTDENFVRALSNPKKVYDSNWNKIQLKFKEYDDWNYQGWVLVSDNADQVSKISFCNQNIWDISWIWNFVNLIELDLFSNEIKEIPNEIWELTNLLTLQLSWNKLITLSSEIWKLTNLTSLNLGWNQLIEVPLTMWNLTSLTYLNLAFNNINNIFIGIGRLSNLIELRLNYNPLKILPKEIWKLTNLRLLDLRNTYLTSLDTRFTDHSTFKTAKVVDTTWDWNPDTNITIRSNWSNWNIIITVWN